MENIYLVGFMGSGKSTVGRILAKKLDRKFVDIDTEIEKEQNKKIKDIFADKGEAYFRQLEKEKIEEFTKKKGCIVSTGGGLGADKNNMELMKKTGKVVWLDVDLEEILKRCSNDKNRPLLNQPIEDLKKLYNQRKEVYSLAHIHINTSNQLPEQIAEKVISELNK